MKNGLADYFTRQKRRVGCAMQQLYKCPANGGNGCHIALTLPGSQKITLRPFKLRLLLLFISAQSFLFSSVPLVATAQDSLTAADFAYSFKKGLYAPAPSLYRSDRLYTDTPVLHKNRVAIIAAANIIGYGGTMVGLYSDWYKNYPQTHFHFFNDNNEWKQVDKVGHAYSAYVESNGSMELWRWTGVSRNKRIWIGGLSGMAYQTIIETLDGFSSQWGWSWGDFGANVFGSGLLVSQELAWNEQRIHLKFSFHRKSYGSPDLTERANELYGSTFFERMIKDYNGQTYWLSANLKSFLPQSNLPKWLNVAVGYGADDMFGAVENVGRNKAGVIDFDRRDISRYRQYYIAPDFDFSKIKTRHFLVRFALIALNSFKFPTPSLEFNSKGKFVFHAVHF